MRLQAKGFRRQTIILAILEHFFAVTAQQWHEISYAMMLWWIEDMMHFSFFL